MMDIQANAHKLIQLLGLAAPPVGVRFLKGDQLIPAQATRLTRHRYCQALMQARGGETVLLAAAGMACPRTCRTAKDWSGSASSTGRIPASRCSTV